MNDSWKTIDGSNARWLIFSGKLEKEHHAYSATSQSCVEAAISRTHKKKDDRYLNDLTKEVTDVWDGIRIRSKYASMCCLEVQPLRVGHTNRCTTHHIYFLLFSLLRTDPTRNTVVNRMRPKVSSALRKFLQKKEDSFTLRRGKEREKDYHCFLSTLQVLTRISPPELFDLSDPPSLE